MRPLAPVAVKDGEAAPRVLTLPHMRGRRFFVFGFLWFLMFGFAVLTVGVGNYRLFVRHTVRPFSHLGLGWSEKQGEISLSTPNSVEARRAGIRAGDLIIAIDDQPVSPALAGLPEIERRLIGPEGSTVLLTTRSEGGQTATRRLTRSQKNLEAAYAGSGLTSNANMTIETLAGVLPDLILLATAVLLFSGARKEALPGLLSLSLLFVVATGAGTEPVYLSPTLIVVRDVLNNLGQASLTVGLLVFPNGRFQPRWTLFAAAAIPVLWAIQWFEPASFLWNFSGLILLFLCVVAIAQRYRRLPDGRERQQIRWVMLGTAWAALLFVCATALDSIHLMIPDLPRSVQIWTDVATTLLSGLGIGCIAGGLLISLLRYRLYDADALLSRSAAVAALTLFLGIVFATSEKLIEAFGQAYFGTQGRTAAAAVAAAVAAVLIAPLHGRVHRWAERRFQKTLIALREELPRLAGDLREISGPERIAEVALERIEHGVRATRGVILVSGAVIATRGIEREEASDGTSDALPVRLPLHADGFGDVGELRLGPRPDGSLFGKDEREALDDIAGPLARALAISAARAADAAQRRHELGSLRSLVKALESRLDRLAPPQIKTS